MSKFRVFLSRLIVVVITIVLVNNLLITTVDTFRNEYKENTSVGNIYLGGIPKKDVSEYIEPKFNNFIEELELKFSYNNNTYIEKVDFVEYHHEETLSNIKDNLKSNIILSINTNKLKLLLSKSLPRNIYNSLDYDRLVNDLQNNYTSLATKADVYILDYISDLDLLRSQINTYYYHIDDVTDLANDLKDMEIIIEPNNRFSILETFNELNLSTEELNILATGINSIVLETNFTSFVKSSSRIPYTMVNHDIEVYETAVNKSQNKDFSFYNPYDLSYEVKVEKASGGLRFSLIGIPFDIEYGILTEERDVPYIPLDDDALIPNGAKLINGIDGKEIKVYRYNYEDGKIVNKELIYINYFGPRNETYKVEG